MSGSVFMRLYSSRFITRENSDGGGGGGTDSGATDGVDTGGTDSGGDTGDQGGQADDLSALFTAEEVAAKREALIAAKAEEDRRAALTDAEREAEDTAKAEADRKQEEEAKADQAPEEYEDFKLPEGQPVDVELLNDFKPLAKELNLSQAKAQKLIDLYAEKVAPLAIQRQTDAWNAQLEGWKAECQKDSEIGGDKFDAKVSDAKRVINTIGTPELKKVFDDYGLGNNPELVRVFSRMAQYLKEDSFADGKPVVNGGSALAQRIYPNMNP